MKTDEDLMNSSGTIKKLQEAFKLQNNNITFNESKIDNINLTLETADRYKPLYYELSVLIRRLYRNLSRQYVIIGVAVLQVFVQTCILMLMYSRLGNDYYSIQNRIGILSEFAFIIITTFNRSAILYPKERDLYYREKADGAYSALAFLLSYSIGEIPVDILFAIVLSIMYFGCGLQLVAGKYFIFLFAMYMSLVIGESFGIIFTSLFRNNNIALPVAYVTMYPMIFTCGFFSLNIPEAVNIISYSFAHRYIARLLAINEFTGLTFTCMETEVPKLPNGACAISDGQQVLDIYKFSSESLWFEFGIIIVIAISYRIIGYFILRFRNIKFNQ